MILKLKVQIFFIFDFKLSKEEIKLIDEFNQNHRVCLNPDHFGS